MLTNNSINMNFSKITAGQKQFILIIIFFSIIRIYMGQFLNNWLFVPSPYDDMLLINHSNLYTHFMEWNIQSLTKNMVYPLLINLVNITGISYKLTISLIWILSGLLAVFGINRFISKNKIILILTYLFIIFLPIAFDSMGGTRIYRNSILAPFAIISLITLYIFINTATGKDKNNKKILLWGIISGLFFTLNFYIKEDGIIFLPIFLTCIIVTLAYNLLNGIKNRAAWKKSTKIIILTIIPLLLFGASTLCYKEVNNHYFGINEINDRTEGEFAEFWHNLLIIEDNEKSTKLWVGTSTLNQAWSASPTLQKHPELLNDILHNGWVNESLEKTPLAGDLISWSIRDSMHNVGLFDSEKENSNFLKQVNDELKMAFENGTLKKTDKIFISSSANGKSTNEIIGMKLYIIEAIKSSIFYTYISNDIVRDNASSHVTDNNVIKLVEHTLNDDLINTNETTGDLFKEIIPKELVNIDIVIYQIISYFIVLLSALSFAGLIIFQMKNHFKSKDMNTLLGFEILVLGTYLVQIFGISWFCSWLDLNTLYFYITPCHGVFAVFEILSISGGYVILKNSGFLNKYKKNSDSNKIPEN